MNENSVQPASVVQRVLKMLELENPVKEVPALFAVIVITFVALEVVVARLNPVSNPLSASALQTSLVVGALLLGMVGYFAGNFWDDRFFDPRYSRKGKWINTSRRPYGLFPAGEDLRDARSNAARRLLSPEQEERGVYRAAQATLARLPDQTARVQNPLILSKFVRSFIWPAGLTAAFCGVVAPLVGLIRGQGPEAFTVGLWWMLGLSVIAVGLFVPYFDRRVEHMVRLYEIAANAPPSTAPHQTAAGPVSGRGSS